jgi:hypothetical protein
MSARAEDPTPSTEVLPLSELSHADHLWLYDYWRQRKPAAGLPARRDIDPTDFPKRILPRMAVIAVEAAEGTCRYRYRLAGTEIARRAGRDPTGKTFEELYQGDYLESAKALYDGLRASGRPHFSQRTYPLADGEGYLRYDRLILPLAADGQTVDQFLLLIVVLEQGGELYREGSFERAGKAKRD